MSTRPAQIDRFIEQFEEEMFLGCVPSRTSPDGRCPVWYVPCGASLAEQRRQIDNLRLWIVLSGGTLAEETRP